ncbi:MAG: hypothetical protein QOD75_3956 [Blastocatellia bacterium]|jgi:hypothetical protein|nr:hypothetical protein [Blastocatellia bacterium]
MKFLITLSLIITLLLSPIARAENKCARPDASTNIRELSDNKAPSGFYLEIKRSYIRAYPGWQQNTIILLRSRGFKAFNGDPRDQEMGADQILTVKSLKQSSKPRLAISSVYVGPYPSGKVAEKMIPKLLAALKPLIVKEKKNDELNNRYLFLVGVVRVG